MKRVSIRPDLFAPALAQSSSSPDRVLYVEAGNDKIVLSCVEEGHVDRRSQPSAHITRALMKKTDSGVIRVGIGGWTFEPWRGVFYPNKHPRKRELEYASRVLTSIEVNGTYYGLQKPETFAKWFEETPDNFVFSLKAPRYATNRSVLAEAGETIERFFASGVIELRHKLGPINWQFMPTKKLDLDDFELFLKLLPQKAASIPLQHAVEVRHESFQTPEFIALVRRYGVAIVTAADSKYPLIADVTAPFVYTRIMGTTEGEQLGYSEAALDTWAQRARTWASGGAPDSLAQISPISPNVEARDVYLYVISGHKVSNPQAAISLIKRMS